MKVYSTKNYSQFNTVKGNRKTTKRHVNRLVKSISSNNMIDLNPIMVDKDMNVIDGQHRLLACEMLDMPVKYIFIDESSLETIQMLNSNIKAWSMKDFLESYVAIGKSDYVLLNNFMNYYGLSLSASIDLLSKSSGTEFKEGNFKIKSLRFARSVAEALIKVKPFCENLAVCTTINHVRAWKDMMTNEAFDPEKLINKLSRRQITVERMGEKKDYLRFYEEVYNHKIRDSRKEIRFF